MLKTVSKMSFQLSQRHMETPRGMSMTVPDEALTVRQIFERYVRGQPLDIHTRRTVDVPNMNFDSIDPSELARMELADKHEFLQELTYNNNEGRKRFTKKPEPVTPPEPPEVVEVAS